MAKRDYYQVLGVGRQASDKEIRQAYRRLARQHHPDVNPGDKSAASRFKEIQEAYEVLSDREKRAKYDRFGHAWERAERAEKAGAGFGRSGFRWGTSGQGDPDFETMFGGQSGPGGFGDLIDSLFRGAAGRQRGRRGSAERMSADVEHPVQVSLAETFSGTVRTLDIQQPDGRVKKLEVRIPAGVTEGSRVRVAGQGNPSFDGGQPSDLFLVVSVQPDPRFERKGDDLHVTVRLPLHVAILGGEVKVPTPRASFLALKVPAETQNGQRFRLAGQGMPRLAGGRRGDLLAEVSVELPTRLSEKERQLFSELAKLREGG